MIKTLFKTMLITLAATVAVACDKPTPELPTPPVAKENNISFGSDASLDFKSIVFDETLDPLKSRLYVVASPNAGLTTYAEIMKVENGVYINKPLMVFIAYTDLNKTFDVMTEVVGLYGMANNTGVGAEIKSIMNGMYADVSAGTFSSTHDAKTGNLSITIDLTAKKSGERFTANITGKFTATPQKESDIMKFNNDKLPIVSRLMVASNDATTLFIAPTAVSGTTITQSGHYAMLTVSTSNLGKKLDITKVSSGFELAYSNLSKLDENITISAGKLNGATGTVMMTAKGNDTFEFMYEIKIGENTIYAQTEGVFEQIGTTNIYTIYGDTDVITPILSVVVDKTAAGAMWNIYISGVEGITTVADMTSKGNPIVIATKEALLTGKQISFSSNSDVSISYKGVKYNQASGADGNFKCTLVNNTLTLSEFTVMQGDFFMDGKFIGNNITIIK